MAADKTIMALQEESGIQRMKAIDILFWCYRLNKRKFIAMAGQRQLAENAIDLGVIVKRSNQLQQFRITRFGRQIITIRSDAISSQAFFCCADIDRRGRIMTT